MDRFEQRQGEHKRNGNHGNVAIVALPCGSYSDQTGKTDERLLS